MILTKMVQKQHSKNVKKGIGKSNLIMETREPVNHWAILDEIEAPMWVDLTLESHAIYEGKDDEWFHINHPFHQCSARDLISGFSHSSEHCKNSANEVQGSCSPKIPPSVSKSRGKHYKIRKQEPVVYGSTLNEQRLCTNLYRKSSLLNGKSEKGIKNNASDGKVNDHLNHKSDSAETITTVCSKSVSSLSNKISSAKSGGGEGSSTSTIVAEVTAEKPNKASNHPFGTTSGLLSNFRDSLRKSYVTRQASRVEVKQIRQLDRKSYSGKSSVGSSSHPGGNEIDILIGENMEKTPDSTSVMTISELPTRRVNRTNVHGAPASHAQKMSCKSELHIYREPGKIKDNKNHREGCISQKVMNMPPSTAKSSMRAKGITNRTMDCGKENQYGKMSLAIKSSTKMKEAEGTVQNPKIVKRKVLKQVAKPNMIVNRKTAAVQVK